MKETAFEIKILGNPILRKKAATVECISQEEKDVLSRMAQLMYDKGGIGLAGNQIGVDKCLAVIDIGEGLYKLVNPRIIKKEGIQISEEGCLSIPGACIKVKRAKKVEVSALNELGQTVTLKAEGLLSYCLQHEIDHLNGKLIFDYASFWGKIKIKKALVKIDRGQNDEKLSQSKTEYCKLQL
jgi:peptide deformylase